MIVVKMPRCVVCLLESEFVELLKQNPGIWEAGLRRGKHYARTKKACDGAPTRVKDTFRKL